MFKKWQPENIQDIINKKYTKQQFIYDYYRIAKMLNYSPDPKTWPKTTIFHLLNIKLDKGESSMVDEIYRMRRGL